MRSCPPSRYNVSTVSSVRQTIRRGGNWRMTDDMKKIRRLSRRLQRSSPGLTSQVIASRTVDRDINVTRGADRRHEPGMTRPIKQGEMPAMTPLERIISMKMPFAELKGVTFTEAGKDGVGARIMR